jgi:hypothetical protein
VIDDRALLSAAAVALVLTAALTGCGRLATPASPGVVGSTSAAPTPASSAPATPGAATLDGISQDLNAAGTANAQADSNAQAGDQAAATGDEP